MFATRHCSTFVKNLGDGIRVRLYFAYDIDAPVDDDVNEETTARIFEG